MHLQESAQTIKKYLSKLALVIQKESTLSFFKTKLIDKSRIDDIICCIEASFPDEYKAVIRRTGTGGYIKTYKHWQQVLFAVRNNFKLVPTFYSVKADDALRAIASMSTGIESDFKRLREEL